jgi:signal transduction histidine kinase
VGSHSLGHNFFNSRAVQAEPRIDGTDLLRNAVRNLRLSLLVAISYYAGTRIGFLFTPANSAISTFWPPNALLLAAFLLSPRRMWWAFMLAVLPAHLLAQLPTGVPIERALGWYVGNTGEAMLAAICIAHFRKQERLFSTVRGVIIFLTFGVFGAPLLTSFLDAAVVRLTGFGDHYWMLWITRLSSNMMANITVVPTILFFLRNGNSWFEKPTFKRWAEAGLLGLGLTLFSVLVFHKKSTTGDPVSTLTLFAPLTFLFWAAVRFGSGAYSFSMLLVAVIASWNAIHGRGLLTPHKSPAENVLYLNTLLILFALPSMLLAAVISDRRRAEVVLKNTRNNLIQEQEQERYRIARELHADLAQRLTLLGLEFDQFKAELDPSMKGRLQPLRDQLGGISTATRDLSHQLHPFSLEYLGIVAALRALCRNAHGKLRVTFIEEDVPAKLDPEISLCLYRVAQEVLQNAADSDAARALTVKLKLENDNASLLILDDGVGLDRQAVYSGNTGLASARERLLAMDGTFIVSSTPQIGTTIQASVPLSPS